MSWNVPQPPKYGPKGPGPSTLADWVSFWRWLVNLWRAASEAATVPEAISVTPRANPPIPEAHISQPTPRDRGIPDELSLFWPHIPYPSKDEPHITTIENNHATRISTGTVTFVGTTVTLTAGMNFQTFMVGHWIAINYLLYRVVSYTSPTIVEIDTALAAGGGSYIFSSYPSVLYVKGSFFFELDRTLLYLDEDSIGTVNTNGLTVTWATGNQFDPYWGAKAGAAAIVINGLSYPIDYVTSATTLVLKSSAGVQAAVAFTVTAGHWAYIAGEYYDVVGNIPTDAGQNDDGLLFFDKTRAHLLRYNFGALAFQFAPGDAGAGYIVAGTPSNIIFWAACDGSVAAISQGDGTTANVTTPNLTGDVFLKGAAAQGAQQAATQPTWAGGAVTDDESAHVHGFTVPTTPGQTDGGEAFPGAQAGTFATAAGTAHHHALTDALAVLNAPSEGAGGLPKRINLTWFIRL